KSTPKRRRSSNVTLVAKPGSYALTGSDAVFDVIDTATWQRLQRMEQRLQRRLLEALNERLALPSAPAVPVLKSGKGWCREVTKPVRNELLAMGITEASRWLASHVPSDGKPVKSRSIEKILRNLGLFLKADRGSKQRPK